MTPSINIREFFNQYKSKLQLSFLSSETGLDREIQTSRDDLDSFEAVDYFNVIRTSSIVVIGLQESRYIAKLDSPQLQELFKTLFFGPVSTIIVTGNNNLPDAVNFPLRGP